MVYGGSTDHATRPPRDTVGARWPGFVRYGPCYVAKRAGAPLTTGWQWVTNRKGFAGQVVGPKAVRSRRTAAQLSGVPGSSGVRDPAAGEQRVLGTNFTDKAEA